MVVRTSADVHGRQTTSASWDNLVDPTSATHQNLVQFLQDNSILRRYSSSAFAGNTVPIHIYYTFGDQNVPCQHGKLVPATSSIIHHEVAHTYDSSDEDAGLQFHFASTTLTRQ